MIGSKPIERALSRARRKTWRGVAASGDPSYQRASQMNLAVRSAHGNTAAESGSGKSSWSPYPRSSWYSVPPTTRDRAPPPPPAPPLERGRERLGRLQVVPVPAERRVAIEYDHQGARGPVPRSGQRDEVPDVPVRLGCLDLAASQPSERVGKRQPRTPEPARLHVRDRDGRTVGVRPAELEDRPHPLPPPPPLH